VFGTPDLGVSRFHLTADFAVGGGLSDLFGPALDGIINLRHPLALAGGED
jgi:hypothetical protein